MYASEVGAISLMQTLRRRMNSVGLIASGAVI
jgi:hypothetical protein